MRSALTAVSRSFWASSAPGGVRFDLEAEHRGEAQSAQHAQRVLVKALRRGAHTADHACGEIRLPSKQIHQSALRVICHRIDGEVAARKVLFQCTREGDRRRMAMILVDAVCAEGGDLQIHATAVQGLCAVLEPGLDQRPAAEGGSDLFGPRGRGDVVIVRHHAAQAVPHAAARPHRLRDRTAAVFRSSPAPVQAVSW